MVKCAEIVSDKLINTVIKCDWSSLVAMVE